MLIYQNIVKHQIGLHITKEELDLEVKTIN